MIYYIADLHFCHENVIRLDNRPFDNIEAMNEKLIQNWNQRVTEEDTVYVLGDAFWKNEEKSISILTQLKGHKHLIRGNHDGVKGKLAQYWESISDYLEINDGGKLVVLSHYPMPFYNHQHSGAIMLYGHIHNSREWKLMDIWRKLVDSVGIPGNFYNVGCMLEYMDYTPRSLDEILCCQVKINRQ